MKITLLLLTLLLLACRKSPQERAEANGLVCWECSVVSFPMGGINIIRDTCIQPGYYPKFTDSQGNMPENWCRKK